MSRPPRFSYAHALHHVTSRCNNREFLFTDSSFELFHNILQEARSRFPLSLYNYCLMTNHVHLLFAVGRHDTLSKAMHWIGSTFSRRFNKATGRHGHLWEGRYRSTIVEDASYFFCCMAYVDLNPDRAGMDATPLDYRWSGHRALQKEDSRDVDFHRLYLDCGRDARSRYTFYAGLLQEEAARPTISLATEYFVGTPKFVSRMVKRFGMEGASALKYKVLGSGITCAGPKRGRHWR
jgi:putative transposase